MRRDRTGFWVLGCTGLLLLLLLLLLGGCPGETVIADDNASQGGGTAGAGDGSGSGGGGTAGSGSGGTGCPAAVPELCRVCADGSCGTPVCVDGAWEFSCGGGAGSGGSGSGTDGGSGGGGTGGGGTDACPPNTAIPAICQLCADGSCGSPVCTNGTFTGDFRCPVPVDEPPANCDCALGAYVPVCGNDGNSYDSACGRECVPVPIACNGECPCTDCVAGGCSGQLCLDPAEAGVATTCEWRDEYACYQQATCARQPDGQCAFTATDELLACLANPGGGTTGGLHWFSTCGDPVCSTEPDADDPTVPNCTGAITMGAACDTAGDTCETLSCGGSMVCAATNPIGNFGCPISRAKFKDGIAYLDDSELARLHDEVTRLPLATWHYKHLPKADRQLGFVIEDIEPSAAVAGDHVNVYGYLSMAVAAIQVQQRQIDALQAELGELRSARGAGSSEPAPMCSQ